MIPPTTPVPTTIQSLTVILKDWLDTSDQDAGQGSTYTLVLHDQNGRRLRWQHEQGDLIPHITTDERDWLMAFMTSLRERAEATVIG